MSKKLFTSHKSILATTTIAATFGIALFSTNADAKCYLIYCQPSQQAVTAPPPPPSYNYNKAQNNDSYYEEDVTFYEDGTNKKKTIKKKVTHKKPIVAKKAPIKIANKAKVANKNTIAKKAGVKKTGVKPTIYASNNYDNNRVIDHASEYGAPQKSGFVPLKIYGGRGEAWVSGHTSVVRYSQPMHIKNVNGTPCGYSRPIGQPYGQAVMVCKCEQGWQPR